MTEKEARKRVQIIALFFNLHTLARNAKHYTPLDDNGVPVAEEMRMLDFYVREINRHDGRRIMRKMLQEIKADEEEKRKG